MRAGNSFRPEWGRRLWHWAVRAGRSWQARSAPRLKLCETLQLGDRRFVAVVQFEQQRFLVGGTGSSLVLLTQLAGETGAVKAVAGDWSWQVLDRPQRT